MLLAMFASRDPLANVGERRLSADRLGNARRWAEFRPAVTAIGRSRRGRRGLPLCFRYITGNLCPAAARGRFALRGADSLRLCFRSGLFTTLAAPHPLTNLRHRRLLGRRLDDPRSRLDIRTRWRRLGYLGCSRLSRLDLRSGRRRLRRPRWSRLGLRLTRLASLATFGKVGHLAANCIERWASRRLAGLPRCRLAGTTRSGDSLGSNPFHRLTPGLLGRRFPARWNGRRARRGLDRRPAYLRTGCLPGGGQGNRGARGSLPFGRTDGTRPARRPRGARGSLPFGRTDGTRPARRPIGVAGWLVRLPMCRCLHGRPTLRTGGSAGRSVGVFCCRGAPPLLRLLRPPSLRRVGGPADRQHSDQTAAQQQYQPHSGPPVRPGENT